MNAGCPTNTTYATLIRGVKHVFIGMNKNNASNKTTQNIAIVRYNFYYKSEL